MPILLLLLLLLAVAPSMARTQRVDALIPLLDSTAPAPMRGASESGGRTASGSLRERTIATDPALRAEVQAVNDSMAAAFSGGDMRAVARFYTDDAIVDGPRGERVVGRAAVEAYWASIRDPRSWRLEVLEVGGTWEQPWQTGRSTLVIGGPNGDRTSVVEFLAIWRRDAGGGLRMAVDYYRY